MMNTSSLYMGFFQSDEEALNHLRILHELERLESLDRVYSVLVEDNDETRTLNP